MLSEHVIDHQPFGGGIGSAANAARESEARPVNCRCAGENVDGSNKVGRFLLLNAVGADEGDAASVRQMQSFTGCGVIDATRPSIENHARVVFGTKKRQWREGERRR